MPGRSGNLSVVEPVGKVTWDTFKVTLCPGFIRTVPVYKGQTTFKMPEYLPLKFIPIGTDSCKETNSVSAILPYSSENTYRWKPALVLICTSLFAVKVSSRKYKYFHTKQYWQWFASIITVYDNPLFSKYFSYLLSNNTQYLILLKWKRYNIQNNISWLLIRFTAHYPCVLCKSCILICRVEHLAICDAFFHMTCLLIFLITWWPVVLYFYSIPVYCKITVGLCSPWISWIQEVHTNNGRVCAMITNYWSISNSIIIYNAVDKKYLATN